MVTSAHQTAPRRKRRSEHLERLFVSSAVDNTSEHTASQPAKQQKSGRHLKAVKLSTLKTVFFCRSADLASTQPRQAV